MEFINKVEVCGMIGTIHTESISSTSKVTTLTVCVNETYTDAGGNAVMETTWFKVSVWNSDEELNVGDFVHIKGKFRMRRYIDSTNNERVTYDIVANEVHTLKVEQKMKRFKVKLCLFNNPSDFQDSDLFYSIIKIHVFYCSYFVIVSLTLIFLPRR